MTPGFRFEHVNTSAEGRPIVGKSEQVRTLPMVGVGATFRATGASTIYANMTQAYRPTLLNDHWRPDSRVVVDPDLDDMTGWVAEYGYRGTLGRSVSFDVGGFYIKYMRSARNGDDTGAHGSDVLLHEHLQQPQRRRGVVCRGGPARSGHWWHGQAATLRLRLDGADQRALHAGPRHRQPRRVQLELHRPLGRHVQDGRVLGYAPGTAIPAISSPTQTTRCACPTRLRDTFPCSK